MRAFVRAGCSGFLMYGLVAIAGCSADVPGTNDEGDPASSSGSTGGSSATGGSRAPSGSGGGAAGAGGSPSSMGSGGSPSGDGGSTGGVDAAVARGSGGSGGASAADARAGAEVNPSVVPTDCGGALFCENFDNYPAVTKIINSQRFGPWHAALRTGSTMDLNGAHKVSGANALHVHIDGAVTAGGRLFADGSTRPLFAAKATHIYGRMMMYIDPNGTSVHWTFFGVNGPAEPGSPVAGRNASYIMSSLPRRNMNTYSFVYGLSAPEGYHDCSSQSSTSMPSNWACISFEMDSVARKLRMYKDGAATPILSVDDHGRGCVAPTSATDPWYGPIVNQIFVGAWSFHQMNGPLDVWIDDLVVDTKPVPCPTP